MAEPAFFRYPAAKPPPSPVWKAYLQLDRTQWLPPEELERLQMRQLQALLGHCRQQVPYYRGIFQACGAEPGDIRTLGDFRRLPLLSRRTWQERFPEFMAEKLPPKMTALGTASTSGTSGVAIELRQTNITALWWLAFYLRDLEWCQIDPRGTLACIRTVKMKTPEQKQRFLEGMSYPFWHPTLRDVIQSGTSYGMDLHQDPRRQLAWLRQIDPNYLLSHPPNLDYLAHLIREASITLPSLRGSSRSPTRSTTTSASGSKRPSACR